MARQCIFVFLSLSLTLLWSCETKKGTIGNATGTAKVGTKSGRTETGYRYILHQAHDGIKPQIGDEVVYHQMFHKNDSLVRSTYLNFEPVKAIMPPRSEVANPPPPPYDGLFLMSIMDSISLYQPLDTFPNYKRPTWTKKEDTLVYHLKLLSIRPKAVVDIERDSVKAVELIMLGETKQRIEAFNAKTLDYKKTDSGLGYIIHDPGTGAAGENKKYVQLHYAGFKMDGTVLDNTYARMQPANYRIGYGKLKGWDEILTMLKEGGRATIFVPSKLAYGEKGRQPKVAPNEDLTFYIELVKVN